ncbi:MAG TPA: DUF1232 domain-containing protein [Actinomycetota bacterium]|jgi:uncharacterized membrane protein YkvA (DUF1232 family)|nr:DUF1232 domain-containing protein [Actinomycetota bacterium]
MPGWLVAILVLVGVWIVAIAGLAMAGRRSAARALATLLPNLVVLFRGLLGDPRVSRGSKALVWFAVVWVVSPIDLIPEFIPIAGPLDDAIVAALVLRHVLRRSGAEVVAEHWRGDPATLNLILGVGRRSV